MSTFLPSRRLTRFLLAMAFALPACGFEGPYKSREKACKLNCAEPASSGADAGPRQTAALSFSLGDWVRQTPRKALDNEALTQLLTRNHIAGFESLLLQMQEDSVTALRTSERPEAQRDTMQQCLVRAFQAGEKEPGDIARADFGKCLPLAQLAQTEKDGSKTAVWEFERALQFGLWEGSENAAGRALRTSPLALSQAFPFNTAAGQWPTASNRLLATRISVVGSEPFDAKGKSRGTRFRDWQISSLGLDATRPMRISSEHADALHVTLDGPALVVAGTVKNPKAGEPFQGEGGDGRTLIYDFVSFKMSTPHGTGVGPLGFHSAATLEGAFLIGIHGRTFLYEAQGAPCLLEVSELKPGEDETPTKSALGKVNLCAN